MLPESHLLFSYSPKINGLCTEREETRRPGSAFWIRRIPVLAVPFFCRSFHPAERRAYCPWGSSGFAL